MTDLKWGLLGQKKAGLSWFLGAPTPEFASPGLNLALKRTTEDCDCRLARNDSCNENDKNTGTRYEQPKWVSFVCGSTTKY